ncbi:hypothetical protein [Spartinivicinus poritis]|uniref:Uncharacterized protein n=1 Tax=Spartinivicinus poritis TaxID=2994640 RepID=A0ABT5U571_9GAMM|nr:hypothetical protein [Spartinivicinus sp. A2-2]MDE1461501.1 hypothetical protein [Spartinivicinus sp. A2-2]
MRYCLFGIIWLSLSSSHVLAVDDIAGSFSLENRFFLEEGSQSDRPDYQLSLSIAPELYWASEDEKESLTLVSFFRWDNQDSERTHADIRELMWLHVGNEWELRVGVGKVFWGVTESVHLVDVINQTDFVETVDGEEKLGQPMLFGSWIKSWGTLDVFLLPWFRERTFPGDNERFSLSLPIKVNNAEYQSSAEQQHVDFVLRWSHTIEDWDIGTYYFHGTSRDPDLVVKFNGLGNPELVPFYPQMKQFGVDIQATLGAWLWKLEAIYRDSTESYWSTIAGFEYTFVGVLNSNWDIGVLAEYQYDQRGTAAPIPHQNDLFLGGRFVVNDVAGTEILMGAVKDLNWHHSYSGLVEASTRLSNQLKLSLEAYFFASNNIRDANYPFRNDDYIQVGLKYYF